MTRSRFQGRDNHESQGRIIHRQLLDFILYLGISAKAWARSSIYDVKYTTEKPIQLPTTPTAE